MKRRTVNLLFGGAALICAGATLLHTVALFSAKRTNATVEQLQALPLDQELPLVSIDSPRVGLARAVAIAQRGQIDSAAEAYNAVIAKDRDGPMGRTALLNLGNLYMREATRSQDVSSVGARSMVELAKQRYRDLLVIAPDDWDARFNLERALRLSPETDGQAADGEKVIKERRRIRLRGMSSVQLP